MPRITRRRRGRSNSKPRCRGRGGKAALGCRSSPRARDSFHAELVANAEAEEEEENGAEDGLNGGQDFQERRETVSIVTESVEKILPEAEDVEGIRSAEARGLPGL